MEKHLIIFEIPDWWKKVFTLPNNTLQFEGVPDL